MIAFLAGPLRKYLVIGRGAALLAAGAYLYIYHIYHQGEAAVIALERARAAGRLALG